MMRRFFLLSLALLLTVGSQARAASLADLINAGYSAVCASPATPYLEVSSICALYQTFQNGLINDEYLQNLADYAVNSLTDAALTGLGDALGTAFLNDLNEWAKNVQKTINHALNLPYLTVDRASALLEQTLYAAGLELLRPPPTPTLPTPPDLTYNPSGVLAQEGVPAEAVRGANELKRQVADAAQKHGQEVAKIAQYQAATALLEEKAGEVRKEAEREGRRKAQQALVAKAGKSMKAIADQAAAVSNRNPAAPGTAEQYRQAAENAASDRELLELMVKALADLMDQQGVYAAKTAELLVQQARLQAFNTDQLIEATRKAAARARSELAINPDFAAEAAARAYAEAYNDLSPQQAYFFTALTEACKGLRAPDTDCAAVMSAAQFDARFTP